MYQYLAQKVHWSNSSCTLQPWVCYFKEGNELTTFGIISHPQIPIFTLSLAITPELMSVFYQ